MTRVSTPSNSSSRAFDDPSAMRYRSGVGVSAHEGQPPYFSTAESGIVVTDAPLVRLWSAAATAGSFPELEDRFAPDREIGDIVRESLACLAEARLLDRTGAPFLDVARLDDDAHNGPLVSIVIVLTSPSELEFLDDCLQSIADTRYRALEVIIVDNDSRQDLRPIVGRHLPSAVMLSLAPRRCLAAACNTALSRAAGSFAVLMNPDVKLTPDTVSQLVKRGTADANVAAVVPKTRLWRTPAFLNAIGNRVRANNWGTDNAIGQLDLGQYDHWRTSPSASLTIALYSRQAWLDVGPFDEAYPRIRGRRLGLPRQTHGPDHCRRTRGRSAPHFWRVLGRGSRRRTVEPKTANGGRRPPSLSVQDRRGINDAAVAEELLRGRSVELQNRAPPTSAWHGARVRGGVDLDLHNSRQHSGGEAPHPEGACGQRRRTLSRRRPDAAVAYVSKLAAPDVDAHPGLVCTPPATATCPAGAGDPSRRWSATSYPLTCTTSPIRG